jgi:nucleotidyltransferase-like protein
LLNQLTKVAKEIFESKYPNASVVFLAGSIVRGEGTPCSDLDLVVIFDKLPAAYRESFYFQGFPVEAFVHDPETLNYFFYEVDRPSGIPSLAQMILEGVEVPKANDLSQSLKRLAASAIELCPEKLSEEDIRKLRYNITNLVDDIRQPRSKAELVATGAELYEALADCYFRTNNIWSAKGKSIPRMLKQVDDNLSSRYCDAFEDLFVHGQAERVIALAEEILRPAGGFLFDGHKLNAPEAWRKQLA